MSPCRTLHIGSWFLVVACRVVAVLGCRYVVMLGVLSTRESNKDFSNKLFDMCNGARFGDYFLDYAMRI